MRQEPEFTSMNVSIPQSQKEFVERRVASGGYASVSEYIRDLIRRDEREAGAEKDVFDLPGPWKPVSSERLKRLLGG